MTRAIAAGRVLASIMAVLCSSSLLGAELAGQVNFEHRQFFSAGAQGQSKGQTSLVLQPELYWELQDGDARVSPLRLFIVGTAWMMIVRMLIFEKPCI